MPANDEETRLYGRGWAFPPAFELAEPDHGTAWGDGGVAMASGVKNVEQSLSVLFQTQPGERIMREGYGCDMQSAVFANLGDTTLAVLRTRVLESVARYEPRVQVISVEFEEEPQQVGWLRITVSYRLPGQSGVQRLSGAMDIRDGRGGVF